MPSSSWAPIISELAGTPGHHPEEAWAVLMPGQSGHPFSRWYQDQVLAHVRGELLRLVSPSP